jgi:hypothetical protein
MTIPERVTTQTRSVAAATAPPPASAPYVDRRVETTVIFGPLPYCASAVASAAAGEMGDGDGVEDMPQAERPAAMTRADKLEATDRVRML